MKNNRWIPVWRGKAALTILATAVAYLCVPSQSLWAAEQSAQAAEAGMQTAGAQAVILHTNDVHAAIDNYPKLAAYRQELLNEGYDVITIDAGDAIQGETIGMLTEGSAIAELMNQVPYDLAVPGNHEFDYGMDTFLDLAKDKESYPSYEYICCNFVDLSTGEPVFSPYEIRELAGHKVGFVGIDTPESYTKSTPVYFQDDDGNFIYSFEEDNLAACVQNAVDSARADGAEYVIAVAHLGIDGVTPQWTSKAVAAATTGIDAMIDGHDHQAYEDTFLNKNGEKVVHAETGYSFQNIGQLTLTFGADGDLSIEQKLVPASSIAVTAASPENARKVYGDLQKLVDDDHAETAWMQEEIGTSEVKLETLDADDQWLARYQETAMGDFTADAYRGVLHADIAFVNGGGIRGSGMNAGTITRKDVLDINPWGNEMCVIEATGQQILDFLEFTSSAAWDEKAGHLEPNGSFMQPSGLTYEINAAGESPVVTDDKWMFVSFDSSKMRRVQNVKVNGQPIDPEKTYTVAGSAYVLQNSAEGEAFFKGDRVVSNTDLTDGDILAAYVTDILPGNAITAALYGKAQGRIVIRTDAEKAVEATLQAVEQSESAANAADTAAPAAQTAEENSTAADAGSESAVSEQEIDLQAVALLVIRGDYGNGQVRVERLTAAGYPAAEVQQKVNELMRAAS